MQLQETEIDCSGTNQLLVIQNQGDNSPIIFTFPYDVTGSTFTGTINFPVPIELSLGTGLTVDSIISCTGSISSNILTISAMSTGSIYLGMPITGLGIAPNTFITLFNTGTGGIGTYTVNQGQTVNSTIISASKIALQLTSADTQNVPEGQYPFDLWSTDSGGVNTDPITGFFIINPSITVIS